MTALAPRKRPIFARRMEAGPQMRPLALMVLVVAIAGASFAAGVQYGAQAHASPAVAGVQTAHLD